MDFETVDAKVQVEVDWLIEQVYGGQCSPRARTVLELAVKRGCSIMLDVINDRMKPNSVIKFEVGKQCKHFFHILILKNQYNVSITVG